MQKHQRGGMGGLAGGASTAASLSLNGGDGLRLGRALVNHVRCGRRKGEGGQVWQPIGEGGPIAAGPGNQEVQGRHLERDDVPEEESDGGGSL